MVAWAFRYWHTGWSRGCDKRMFFVSGVLCYTVHMIDTWKGRTIRLNIGSRRKWLGGTGA